MNLKPFNSFYVRIYKVFFIVILSFFYFSCNEQSEGMSQSKARDHLTIDDIKGDKILDIHTSKIRTNNFEKIMLLSKDDLLINSKLYNIKKIDSNVFLISQKRNYESARHFNILIQTKENKIKSYRVFNDFSISDIAKIKNGWLLLCSDHNNQNSYWKRTESFYAIKIDENFNEIWKYNSPISELPMQGISIQKIDLNIKFKIHLITICDICYSISELELDSDGNFVSIKEVDSHNGSLMNESLQNIFLKK